MVNNLSAHDPLSAWFDITISNHRHTQNPKAFWENRRNGFKRLTIFAKRSILDVWQGSQNVSGLQWKQILTG